MNKELYDILKDTESELYKIKEWVQKYPFDNKVLYLNSYAVIKASGSIELTMKTMIYQKLTIQVNDEVKKYLSKRVLESSFNPSTGKIEYLLQDLNGNWSNLFKEYLKRNPQKKAALNSLVEQRNTFAHGNKINMSIDSIADNFKSGVEILEELYDILNQNIKVHQK